MKSIKKFPGGGYYKSYDKGGKMVLVKFPGMTIAQVKSIYGDKIAEILQRDGEYILESTLLQQVKKK